jgi:hypothetical protein
LPSEFGHYQSKLALTLSPDQWKLHNPKKDRMTKTQGQSRASLNPQANTAPGHVQEA